MQPWPICRKFLGVVLLVAAGMKAHELATLPILPQRFFAQRWFWLTAVEAEGVLGAWLILASVLKLPAETPDVPEVKRLNLGVTTSSI